MKKIIALAIYFIFFIIFPYVPLRIGINSRIYVDSLIIIMTLLFIIYLLFDNIRDSFYTFNLKSFIKQTSVLLIILFVINTIYNKTIFTNIEIKSYKLDIWNILKIIVVAPIFEELIFRYSIIIYNKSKNICLFSVILSSLFFTFQHRINVDGNILSLISILNLSLFLSYIYVKNENILYAIGFHMFYNIIILTTTIIL